VIQFLKEHINEFSSTLRQPALGVLLAYKDTVKITDSNWEYTMTVFGLNETSTLHHISRAKNSLNVVMDPQVTSGGHGWEFPLLSSFPGMAQ